MLLRLEERVVGESSKVCFPTVLFQFVDGLVELVSSLPVLFFVVVRIVALELTVEFMDRLPHWVKNLRPPPMLVFAWWGFIGGVIVERCFDGFSEVAVKFVSFELCIYMWDDG